MNGRLLNRWFPYLTLLAEVLFFHRYILLGRTVIPWDIRTYHLPQALFVSKALRGGELPLWNPFIYCGHPFAANIQTALFYPPRFLATLLGGVTAGPMLYSLEIELILHILLGGIFAFLLMRELGIERGASLAAATSFQLGAFFTSQAEHLGAIEAAAWLPLTWLLVLRLSRKFDQRNAVLLSGAIAMSLLTGFTPLTTVTLVSNALLILLLMAYRQATPKLFGVFLFCFAASLLLCAVVFFPAAQLTLLSVSRFRSDWIGNGGGLPLASLYSLFWPNSFGVLERGSYKGPYDITFMYLYAGVVMLFGALSLVRKRPLKGWAPFAVLFSISTLFMLGASTPFGTLYSHVFPAAVRGVIYPQEWIAPFSLSLCVLGAFGISAFQPRTPVSAALVAIAICDLTGFGSNRPFNSADPKVEPGVTETSFAGSQELLTTVRRVTGPGYPPARIDTVDDSIDWAGSAMITDVPTAGGEDPMALIRYIQARLAFVRGERWGYYYQVSNIQSPVLQSLNVCCILTRKRISAKSAYSGPTEVPGGFLYYSPSALPRFHLVHQIWHAADVAEATAMAKRADWDPAKAAIVENPPRALLRGEEQGGQDRVSIQRYRRNSVRLETESKGAAFLTSSESNFPGWKATVDGQPAAIYDTNVAFRGLPLSAGRHVVEFQFAPCLLIFSSAVSAAAWAVFFLLLYRSRKRGHLLQ